MSEALKGTNVASPIVPFTTDDIYATHEAKYGKGGYRTVENKEELLNIPEARLEEGMLAYVINDEDNVHTYQYLRTGEGNTYEWVKSKIGSGVTKVDTIEERETLSSEIGDLVYVSSEGSIFMKLSENYWRPISFGIPIFTKQQEDDLDAAGKLPEDFISIPDPSELTLPTETTTYVSTGRGYYLDIIFSTLRSLQAEVAKLRNSFNYGINSYTGKETAMGRVVGSYDIPEEEPLWAVDEEDLSYIKLSLDLNNNNGLVPSENVSIGDNYLIINGTAEWTDSDSGFLSVDDTKIYLFLTTDSLNFQVNLTGLSEDTEHLKTINFSTLGLRRYESSKYNIMICVSRTIIDEENTYGKNFVWISVGNYVTGGAEDMGYWNPTTNKLQSGIVQLDDRYTINSVSFTDLKLYKFNGYSKYQDLSSTVDPITPTDDGYKYRVAHITIRSVKNEDELMSIKNQLPANELIYNEQTGVLWIKTSSGTVRPISGSGGQQEDDGMTQEDIKDWLKLNGIIVSNDGDDPVQLNKISDITFIHQETGKKFKFTVNSEGELVSEEIPEVLMEGKDGRLAKSEYTLNGQRTNLRGFVGMLGLNEKRKLTGVNETDDLGLYSDRVKIGSIYSPNKGQLTYGCSHAFIELENTSDKDFPLDGCYLHYATGHSSGTDRDITTYHLALQGFIPAGGTYLIRGKQYSGFDQANTFIKVETFDQEWFVEKNGVTELIDLTQNDNNTYLLTYGLPTVSDVTQMIDPNNSETTSDKFPKLYHSNYIDSVSINDHVKDNNQTPWVFTGAQKFSIPTVDGKKLDVICKNTFELDPAKQAYQSCDTSDSSRFRNEKAIDFQYLVLAKDIIEFPKSSEVFPVANYTPKASWQHKNVCTDKTKLDKDKPNMVTVSYGINMYKTRCFNWISCGLFDEYIWIREEGQTEWQARFESYKDGTENDDRGTSGMTKRTFGNFYNKTVNESSYPIQNVIYNRITNTFPADGTKYTAHKCIVNVVSQAISAGNDPQVYEYIVGRADKNLNPDPEHTSTIQTFTLYPMDYTPRIFQITDQQGFHWIEYQVWAAAAEKINNTINEITEDSDSKIMPVLINTGDMTQNGTRINEWYDYYTGGYCLFNHLEQANLVGNNDLCNTNPNELGTGDDYGKSNGYYFHVFYCYEIDETILPIISNTNATKYVPSLYYFEDDNNRFIMLNTEITAINCRDWFEQKYNIGGVSHAVNVYTGWTIKNEANENDDRMKFDKSFTTIYEMIYHMLDSDKDTIVACHEMPFTVITNANLDTRTNQSIQDVDRSLNKKTTGALVGCHCNRLNNLDVKGIYWLSRLLEHFNVKLCIGGHKHTYACTNPVREFYSYKDDVDDEVIKNSIVHGKMTMGTTLENDTAVWETTLHTDNNTGNYTINGSGSEKPFNTTKFPIMKVDDSTNPGVVMPNNNIYYPYYGVHGDNDGVTYFMCQATGYKQKSNKELPSNNQKFSYVIPKTEINNGADSPSEEQLYPMFSEIVLNGSKGSKSYTIYLYRITNIMMTKANGKSNGKFSQTEYSTAPASYNWLKGNESSTDLDADKIYGNWGYNVRTPLIII